MHQLRYEGPRLEDLLSRIQQDHGPAARILAADKSRRGGVGGFFAKEIYEVTVEVEVEETLDAYVSAAAEAPSPAAPAIAAASVAPEAEPAAAGPDEWIEDDWTPGIASPVVDGLHPPAHLDVTEGREEFAALLARLVAEADGDGDGRSQVDLTAASPDPAPDPDPAAPGHSHEPALPVVGPVVSSTHHAGPSASDRRPLTRPDLGAGPVVLDRLLDQAASRLAPAPPVPRRGLVCVVGPRLDATRAAVALARAEGQLPEDVIIVPSRANDQLPPELVATFVDQWRRQRSARPEMSGPVFVVIELCPVLDGYRWVNGVLASLRPAQIRLAATARWVLREIDNVRASAAIPDVLDVYDVSELTEPDRLLEAGVPVATVDSSPSSVAAWAAILLAGRPDGPVGFPVVTAAPSRPNALARPVASTRP